MKKGNGKIGQIHFTLYFEELFASHKILNQVVHSVDNVRIAENSFAILS